MDWPTVVLEIAKYSIPAAITGIVSVLITRSQWKAKEIEIRGQADLKAREILFDSYQKRIDRISNFGHGFGESIGRLLPYVQEEMKTEQGKNSFATVFLEVIKLAVDSYKTTLAELEEELQHVGLLPAKQSDLSFIKKMLAVDFSAITPNNFGPVYLDFIKTVALMHGLREELLHKKCDDLFRPYLNRQT